MIRVAALAVPLALAACGEAPERAPPSGQEARAAMDAATAAYAECVERETLKTPPGGVPGTVVLGAVRACAPARQELAARIVSFHRIGRPSYTQEQLDAVAEASIEAIEPEIREEAIAAYITRSSSTAEAK
jgi:hypothetical protein